MKKAIKKFVTLGLVFCLTVASCITAFAGEWKKDPEDVLDLWWYQRDDGSYPMDCWELIDGKYYHFDVDGYLETDCVTYDGYLVDENGAWVESVPQKTPEEVDEYYKQNTINYIIGLYEGGWYFSEAEFEEDVKSRFSDPVEAEFVLDEIRNNHTFVPEEW